MKINQFLLLVFSLLIVPLQSWSQETTKHPILEDKFYFEARVVGSNKKIEIGANGATNNDDIDFGDTFDLKDNEVTPFFNAEWRWNKKWRAAVEYFGVNNGSSATLQEDIVFEDIIFKAGTSVRGGVEFNLLRVFVGRVISTGPKHSLGAGLGIHGVNIGAFIEGNIDIEIDEGQFDKQFERRKVSALIPLPNIGGWYNWAPNEKWALVARVDWFGITIDKYSGGLWNVAPGVKYQIIKNLGVGLDYRFFFLNARVDETNWDGNFDMNFKGPLLTVHANF